MNPEQLLQPRTIRSPAVRHFGCSHFPNNKLTPNNIFVNLLACCGISIHAGVAIVDAQCQKCTFVFVKFGTIAFSNLVCLSKKSTCQKMTIPTTPGRLAVKCTISTELVAAAGIWRCEGSLDYPFMARTRTSLIACAKPLLQ